MPTPRLVVVSGPSGVGKTTVCRRLLARPSFERVITATTRPPRPRERAGIDYLFVSEAEFDAWVGDDRFLEWAHVHGRRYGSPRDQAEAILARGHHALLNIDVQGAASIRAGDLPCLLVFLLPPSWDELERRLRGRRTDGDDEMARQDDFDLKIVNDDSARAAEEIEARVASL